jgi:pimeloyl-ACP methyl ester carboxylesterase
MNTSAFGARARAAARRALPLLAALLLAACATVRVKPTSLDRHDQQRRADVLTSGEISEATRESLRTIGAPDAECERNPQPCIRRLAATSALDDEERLSAVAELWLLAGIGRDQATDRVRAAAHALDETATLASYLEAARASYAYLFFTARTPGDRALEDRQRQVRDFYNYATERVAAMFVAARYGSAGDDAAEPAPLVAGAWQLRLGFVDVRLPSGRPLAELVPASRLRFVGLRNSYRRDGFGAELVAVAAPPPLAVAAASAGEEVGFVAASVVLRFAGDTLAEVLATREATLDAYDSTRHSAIPLHGTDVRLAASFTAPYALWLERARFDRQAKRALLGHGEELVEPRVYLAQPFDPTRRTVILIHGLASSPATWVDLANDLTGDDEIRRDYQVWEVFYRSGAPLAYNVRAIRAALQATFDRFDPRRETMASRDVVLVGHSMGGVISRLLVLDAGDALWKATLGHAPSAEERSRLAPLAPYLDLAPMPEVSRAVFLAAPHRGAPMASGWIGRFGSRLVRTPRSLLAQMRQLAGTLDADLPDAAARLRRGPDGIDGLSDRFPVREATSSASIASSVTYHSIVACAEGTTTPATCTDGLVPYASAHLDGAASEAVVTPSGHSVQETPQAILELRRILRLHLRELGASPGE